MKKESTNTYLQRRLRELKQFRVHNRIARETGVAQATVSRIYLGLCDPRMGTAQKLLDWLEAHDRDFPKASSAKVRSGSAQALSLGK